MTPKENNRKVLEQVGYLTKSQKNPRLDAGLLSRRTFIRDAGLLAATMALVQVPGLLSDHGWVKAAHTATSDLVGDSINGLVAFIVPGPDIYSVHQGVSTTEPGGINVNITDALIESLDLSVPSPPLLSAVVATILNDVAQQVNPLASGTFSSPFARLAFWEKVIVFATMESLDPLKQLAGILPPVVAFLAYSEIGVFDPSTRTLTGQPVGWNISDYGGVADGRDEFKGYFQNRRKVKS